METEFNATIKADLDNEGGVESILSESKMEEVEEAYEVYAAECNAALKLTLARIESILEPIERFDRRNPFDRIESRMKTFKSVRGKCKARGYELSIESIRDNVKDVAGVRIITKYIDEIDLVKDMLEKIPGINIVKVKDYVKEPKENGYQSVHLDCQVEVYDTFKGSRLVPVEIQIRSKSMNLWATLEHDLKYKNSNPSPDVEEKFRRIAKILRAFDEEAIALRDYDEVTGSNVASANSKIRKMPELEPSTLSPQPRGRKNPRQKVVIK